MVEKLPTKPSTQSRKTKYNKKELAEFRAIINRKLKRAKGELDYLQNQISRKGSFSADDSDSRFRGLDDGAGTLEREQLNIQAARQVKFIDNLEKALMRIENGTYGICRVTGQLISAERLRLVPHTTLSIAAKNSQKPGRRK